MKRRNRIGETYSSLSAVVLGFWRTLEWNKSTKDLSNYISLAHDLGINSFDHADIYGDYQCERLFGTAFKQTNIQRNQVQIISKCGIKLVSSNRPTHKAHIYDTSLDHIKHSVNQSLKNLKTDYLDILLIHRPDPLMNADEVAQAFHELRNEGKVLYFGVSNFNRAQTNLLQSRLDFQLVTNQLEISPLKLDAFLNGTLDYCQQHKIVPMAWSPLGGGELFNSVEQRSLHVLDELKQVGLELGEYAPAQIALAWMVQHPSRITPVIGTGNAAHLESASKADCIKLTKEQWFRIYTVALGHNIP
ncbi:MAG: aldo/keto reductase [Bacteroidales bacterium]|nr:aldo/keto reductase [Bacteroidales bacterium]